MTDPFEKEVVAFLDRLTNNGQAYRYSPLDFVRWCAGEAIENAIVEADKQGNSQHMHIIARMMTCAAAAILAETQPKPAWSEAALKRRRK
jgi:hypothetical protein